MSQFFQQISSAFAVIAFLTGIVVMTGVAAVLLGSFFARLRRQDTQAEMRKYHEERMAKPTPNVQSLEEFLEALRKRRARGEKEKGGDDVEQA